MPRPPFVCLACRTQFVVPAHRSGAARCRGCGDVVEFVDGVPLFLGGVSAVRRSWRTGLAEATFAAPAGYRRVTALKCLLQRITGTDAGLIGASKYVRGCSVLDVGCGPSLDLPNMENAHAEAAEYVGVDSSAEFVLAAQSENCSYRFAQASAASLPFPDKSFDTVLVSWAVHHVDVDARDLIAEFGRVARSTVLIYDHVRHDQPRKRWVQDLYWRFFDGGCNYLDAAGWKRALEGFTVRDRVQTGAIFAHVIKFVCDVPQSQDVGGSASR